MVIDKLAQNLPVLTFLTCVFCNESLPTLNINNRIVAELEDHKVFVDDDWYR